MFINLEFNSQPLDLETSTLPLSHCAPDINVHNSSIVILQFYINVYNYSIKTLQFYKTVHKTRLHSHFQSLTHLGPMEFSIKFNTLKPGWSIIYIEGSQIIIYKISISKDGFCPGKQCRPL